MGAYKKLNKQDAYITAHTAHKTWVLESSEFAEYGITISTVTGSLYSSLQQLYYPKKEGGNIVSHSYDNYNQTSLHFSESRNLTTGSYTISIPRDMYGVSIKPKTLMLLGNYYDQYVQPGYWVEDYVIITGLAPNTAISDDGEGNLYVEGSSPRKYIGDIVYTHGIITITDLDYISSMQTDPIRYLVYKTSHPIFTHTYNCKIRESEYNYTYNPTTLSSTVGTTYNNLGDIHSTQLSYSNGELKSNVTGSEFQPYITTVGLYNDANQLIAVGKLAQPVPKSGNTEMTITVNIDI